MLVIPRGVLALASRGRLSILIFHRVLREPDPMLPGEPSAAQFDALMRHVKARFDVLPLAEAVTRLYAGTLPAAALAVTFDDGYADNVSVAAPILHRHAIPATLFVATGYLDGGCMWNDRVIAAFRDTRRPELDLSALALGRHPAVSLEERRAGMDRVLAELRYRPGAERERSAREILDVARVDAPRDLMLTSDAVRSLVAYGIDAGAHTVSHPILARTPADEAWREICESRRRLGEIVGRRVTLFAYPNGRPGRDYLDEHVRMAREAGFDAAVSTAWGAATRAGDRFELPRFTPWARTPLKFDLLMVRNLRHALAGARASSA